MWNSFALTAVHIRRHPHTCCDSALLSRLEKLSLAISELPTDVCIHLQELVRVRLE